MTLFFAFLATSLLVSPLGLALVVVLVEDRPFVLGNQYAAFLIGDILLAFASAVGLSQAQGRPILSWWLLVPVAIGFAFGWWQMNHEVAQGVYTLAQAHSPSKLYHQFVCYPVLGALVTRAIYLAWSHWVPLAVVGLLIVAWMGCNVWDWSHPKHPHVNFEWSGNAERTLQ